MSDPERTQNTLPGDVPSGDAPFSDVTAHANGLGREPARGGGERPSAPPVHAALSGAEQPPLPDPPADLPGGMRPAPDDRRSTPPPELTRRDSVPAELGPEFGQEKTGVSQRRTGIRPAPADWRPQSSRRPTTPMVVVRSGDAQPLAPLAEPARSGSDPHGPTATPSPEPFPLARDLDRASLGPGHEPALQEVDADRPAAESGPRERLGLPTAHAPPRVESGAPRPRRSRQLVVAAGLALLSSVVAFSLVRFMWPQPGAARETRTLAAVPAGAEELAPSAGPGSPAVGSADLPGSVPGPNGDASAAPPSASAEPALSAPAASAEPGQSEGDVDAALGAASADAPAPEPSAEQPRADVADTVAAAGREPPANAPAIAKRRVRLDVVPFDAKVSLRGLTQQGPPYYFDVPQGKRLAVEVVRRGYITRRVEIDGSRNPMVIGLMKKPGL